MNHHSFSFGLFLTSLLIAFSSANAVMPAGVGIQLKWEYQDIPAKMHIYEASKAKPHQLWEMGSGKSLTDFPVSTEISSQRLKLYPGENKIFVLVMKNDSDAPVYFFAAPHGVNPPALSLGFHFKCLCVNHVYEVPAHGYWYRVVELSLDANVKVGKEMSVTHALIGTTKPDLEN